jgi:uncharacterized protein
MPTPMLNGSRERLDFSVAGFQEELSAPNGLVLLAHGVTGNKDRPWLVALAEALAAKGVPALRFSFSGNGNSEGRFEEATLTKEVDDLGSVVDAVTAWGATRIAYVGHSMGGAIGVLRASQDPRITCLVSLAGMVHVADFMERQFGGLRLGEPMLGKPECPWNEALARDAARIGSLTSQAALITVPWLLVHGDADELVPYQDALDARATPGGRKELVTLPGVDHRFTGAIPALIEAVVPWLTRHLRV